MRAKLNNVRKSDGFTIIEVLIVLAIAGLIMLIVFLAVPALQRNARNTQRKNDVSALLSSVSEYVSNNNGGLPTGSGLFTSQFSGVTPKLSYYTTANVAYTANTAASSPTGPNNVDKVQIQTYAKCANTGGVATNVGASARSIVALYTIETSGGTQPQCQES